MLDALAPKRLWRLVCAGFLCAACGGDGGADTTREEAGSPTSQPPSASDASAAPGDASDASPSAGDASPSGGDASPPASGGLLNVASFGSNPAGLVMYKYVPASMPPNAPLVVVLHGCTQSAAAIAAMGWNGVADAAKFYVVYPEQTYANNALLCFNWFGSSAALARGSGENLSIKQMVDKMTADYAIDSRRVFVAGFSGGAAEALLMLADWPDVFAAGAALAGVPYGCASSAIEAESCMQPGKVQTASAWGALVRGADPGFAGPFPRVSLWHGANDTTVAVANLAEEAKQWTNVLGVSATPTANGTVAGFPHATYADANGNVVAESYEITGMDHAVPIDPTAGCGTVGAYLVDEKLCAAKEIARFFGIAPP